MSDMNHNGASLVPVVANAVAKGHVPAIAPGNIRLIGSESAMAELAPQLEKLHACLHSPDEGIRLATIRTLAKRNVSVQYGPPVADEAPGPQDQAPDA